MVWKRVLGVGFIIIAIIGLLVSVAGVIVSRQTIQAVEIGLDDTLRITADTLDTVHESLLLTKITVQQVSTGLDTVSDTTVNVSNTISYTLPLMDQVTKVTTGDVPDSLESVEAAIPDIAEAAGAIDETLRLLNSFKVDQKIFGIPIQFDLGINYVPENELEETVLELGTSLEGVPDSLRSLEANLSAATENLSVIGQNLDVIAGDLDDLNNTIDQIEPLIDEYLRLTTDTGDLIRLKRSQLTGQLETVQLALTVLFIWIGLNQLVPLFLAWSLLTEKEKKSTESEIIETDQHIEGPEQLEEQSQEERITKNEVQENELTAEDDKIL